LLIYKLFTFYYFYYSQVRKILTRLLNEKEIKILNNTEIIDSEYDSNINKSYLISEDGKKIEYDEAIFCTQACAQDWIRESGLDVTDIGGFINVKTTLESVNSPNVFACGDVAHLVDNPRPKAGVFAVRSGPPLNDNLRARLIGEINLEPWIPQEEFLGIIGTGGGYAVASKGPLGIEGKFLWKLKDKIDRIWMQGYSVLPDMDDMEALKALRIEHGLEERETIPNPINDLAKSMGQDTIDMLSKSKMRCGGCGSKVGSQVLSRALSRVREFAHRRPEVIAGIGVGEGDDCALVTPPAPPAYLVHSIDYFRSFISDPFLFGRIAANHALSDVHAMNGDAVSGLALCVIPYGPEQRVEDTVVQMLAGMMSVMKREGCSLVGGHTSEGTEAALGLSVNGVVHPDRVLRKGPFRSNDVLIVTKGLGTGTIMAADMRGKAKGRWLTAAFESMTLSNSKSASIFFEHGCNACTDITGFGFLGHLLEMLQLPSEEEEEEDTNKFHIRINTEKKKKLLSVIIKLSSVPLLPGASECVEGGIFSSLQPQNIRCARAIGNVELGAGNSTYPLLFDPQTAGGLLGAVPSHRANDCIKELSKAGYTCSSIVGEVMQRDKEDDPLIWLDN
jgi:selenide,water dikinase